ncbi:hypothetical protein AORI_2819 [Amycolatopsis keratiniphila]|uniref:Uncharacterized protein n=1 Tax=Amycolatopsis keratiniphila TaxID=129921 RepID=R4SZ44_9PSEU|nr:hypothetical protein AORI_2819 [Amycolatopsis keratiniphila]
MTPTATSPAPPNARLREVRNPVSDTGSPGSPASTKAVVCGKGAAARTLPSPTTTPTTFDSGTAPSPGMPT